VKKCYVLKVKMFRRRKLALVFRENLFPLNELIGYVDLTVFHDRTFTDVNQTMSANSFILNIFLVAAFNATGYASFSIVQLDRSIKRQPIEIKENADTGFGD